MHDALAVGRSPIVAASIGTWMGAHYAIARPGRVERLAMLSPVGMVGSMRMKWLIKMAIKTQLRPSTAKTEWMLAAITTDETVPKLRAGPWHAIAQQFIFGMPNFRANLREPRPGARCNIERLASSRIPLLILIPRDETGQDGPRTADRYRQQLPHARVELVDDSNHIVFIDRTDVVTDRLKKFLGAR